MRRFLLVISVLGCATTTTTTKAPTAACALCHATDKPMGVNCWASTPSAGGQLIEGKGGLPLGTVCAGTEYTQTYTCTEAYDYSFKSKPATDGACAHYKNACCTAPTPAPTLSDYEHGDANMGSSNHGGGGSYGNGSGGSFSSGGNGHAAPTLSPDAMCARCHAPDKPMGVNCWASTPSAGGQPIEGKGGLPLGTVCAGTEYTQTYTCGQAYDFDLKSKPAAGGDCARYKNLCC